MADNDMVYHPPHYTQGGVECIDAIEASMDPLEFVGYLKGSIIKYMWRFEKKWDPKEDIKKAIFYINKLDEFLTEHPDIPFGTNADLTVKVNLADVTSTGVKETSAKLSETLKQVTHYNA